jgi:hypothetical protein
LKAGGVVHKAFCLSFWISKTLTDSVLVVFRPPVRFVRAGRVLVSQKNEREAREGKIEKFFFRFGPLGLAPGKAMGGGQAGLAKTERSVELFELDTRKADLFVRRGVGR